MKSKTNTEHIKQFMDKYGTVLLIGGAVLSSIMAVIIWASTRITTATTYAPIILGFPIYVLILVLLPATRKK